MSATAITQPEMPRVTSPERPALRLTQAYGAVTTAEARVAELERQLRDAREAYAAATTELATTTETLTAVRADNGRLRTALSAARGGR